MNLLTLVIVLVAVGLMLYLMNQFIPMNGKTKSILNVVIVVLVILWLLNGFGFLTTESTLELGRNL